MTLLGVLWYITPPPAARRRSKHRRRALAWNVVAASVAALALTSCREPTAAYDELETRWLHAQNGDTRARPVIVGTRVYMGTRDNTVVGRNVNSGAIEWTGYVGGEPADGTDLIVSNGTLIVTRVRSTAAFDLATQRLLWTYGAPPDTIDEPGDRDYGPVFRTTVSADTNTAYIPAWGASVSAVDLRTGARRWVWTPGLSAGDTASSGRAFRSGAEGTTVAGDTVFVSVWHYLERVGIPSEPWLVALDARTGREHYRVVIPSYTNHVTTLGAPIVVGRLVIVSGVGGRLWAIDRLTRSIVWQYAPANPTNGTAVAATYHDGILYLDAGDEHLAAVNAADGTPLWRTFFGGNISFGLLATERNVYAPRGQVLFVFDRRTGRKIREVRQPHVGAGSFMASAPAARDGHVFILVGNGAWSFNEP